MSRNLSEDEIRIMDKRGRYSIRKGVVWTVAAAVLLAGILLGVKISRQARFISELTSGQAAPSGLVDVKALDKIRVVEVNGAKVNLTIGQGNLRLLNFAVGLIPDRYVRDPRGELAAAYRVFKRSIGSQHLPEFYCGGVHVKVDYRDGKAFRYTFTNSLNDYSMTVLCSYDELVRRLDKVVR